MPDTVEGQVTFAIIKTELATIRREMNEGFSRMEACSKDHETRIRQVEGMVIRLEQRLTIITGLLSTLTFIGSAIAAWMGTR